MLADLAEAMPSSWPTTAAGGREDVGGLGPPITAGPPPDITDGAENPLAYPFRLVPSAACPRIQNAPPKKRHMKSQEEFQETMGNGFQSSTAALVAPDGVRGEGARSWMVLSRNPTSSTGESSNFLLSTELMPILAACM